MDPGTYQDIDLTAKDVLSLLKIVLHGLLRPSLDLIESRSDVCRGFSFGADRVEVGHSCVLAQGEGDELVPGAFDDGNWNDVARHFQK